jgi:serine/threonine-protein kinase
MGEVYLAQQQSLKRQVALKVLREDMVADETAGKRFAVEAEAAAKLTHANIVQIYAFGPYDEVTCMALEYVQGMNLRDYVARKGPVTPRFAVKVMEQVAAALHHAADAGIVHRDIKPDNILLTRKGEVKVADFGLARLRVSKPVNLTQTGVTMGTPLYMSPEQVEGKELDPRSDLYSFGVTCYYMLTGQPPYRGETALAIAVQHIKGEPEPIDKLRPDLPPDLCHIVQKLMAKDPDQRYQTGRHVSRDLQKLKGELAASARDEAAIEETGKQAALVTVPVEPARASILRRTFRLETMRRYVIWWFAATLLLGLLAGAGYGWYRRAPDLRPRAGDVPPPPPVASWEDVPKEKSAEQQYRYAKFAGQYSDPEAAWLAVINYWSSEPDWVLQAQLQLGQHYLDEHQLEKGQRHFTEMNAAIDEKTRLAGEVGKAAVLSLRPDPVGSQTALWETVKDSPVASDPKSSADRMVLGMILTTLERNYRNLGIEWDPDVKDWATRKLQKFRRTAPGDQPPPGQPGRSPNG